MSESESEQVNLPSVNLPAVINFNDSDSREHYAFEDIDCPRQRMFLQALARSAGPTGAERLSGINRDNHYWWLNTDPNEERRKRYSAATKKAIRLSGDYWEDDVAERAYFGEHKPIIYKGRITGYYREKSPILAMFRLNGERPEKYHTNTTQDASTAPVTINIVSYSATVNVAAPGEKQEQVAQPADDAVKISKW